MLLVLAVVHVLIIRRVKYRFLSLCVFLEGGGWGPDTVKPPIRGRGGVLMNQPFATCFFSVHTCTHLHFIIFQLQFTR